ncbi:MAG: hypothetical protein HN505_07290 [Verrucomicrobia bacterium]|nr:hypothetical protein [Verrucomicrobiota bacterium]MBT5477477.1 hypothetical protein [Verrucomicrobiota bacterium]
MTKENPLTSFQFTVKLKRRNPLAGQAGTESQRRARWEKFTTDDNPAIAYCEKLKLRGQADGVVEMEWFNNQDVNDIRFPWAKDPREVLTLGLERKQALIEE